MLHVGRRRGIEKLLLRKECLSSHRDGRKMLRMRGEESLDFCLGFLRTMAREVQPSAREPNRGKFRIQFLRAGEIRFRRGPLLVQAMQFAALQVQIRIVRLLVELCRQCCNPLMRISMSVAKNGECRADRSDHGQCELAKRSWRCVHRSLRWCESSRRKRNFRTFSRQNRDLAIPTNSISRLTTAAAKPRATQSMQSQRPR